MCDIHFVFLNEVEIIFNLNWMIENLNVHILSYQVSFFLIFFLIYFYSICVQAF